MGHKSVAVIERWLFNRGSNICHYIASDLKQVAVIVRWLLYRVTTKQRFHCIYCAIVITIGGKVLISQILQNNTHASSV